jgi:predicted RNase H-like HicB family nuclease
MLIIEIEREDDGRWVGEVPELQESSSMEQAETKRATGRQRSPYV